MTDSPIQDAIPEEESQTKTFRTVPNVFDEHRDALVHMDSEQNTIEQQARRIAALEAQLNVFQMPDATSAPQGGPPILHHLHLVDGRVVANHEGIGTHFSERLPDGSTRVTRIDRYFPANEPDPTTRYA